MKSIIQIINLHFWKSITGPFFAFGFPVIFLSILGFLLGYEQLLGSIISIPAVTVGITVLPTALYEFKTSSLLKRIGATPIKPWTFILAISLYYVVIMFLSTLTTICFGLLLFCNYWNEGKQIVQFGTLYTINAPSLKNMVTHVNWGGLLWAVIMNILVSGSIGIFISTVCKSAISIQGIGVPVLIISGFLAAQYLPISMVKEINGLYWLSYISPFKYSTGLIIESWNGILNVPELSGAPGEIINITFSGSSNIFNVKEEFYSINAKAIAPNEVKQLIFKTYDKVLNIIMPIAITAVFSGLITKTFKWSAR